MFCNGVLFGNYQYSYLGHRSFFYIYMRLEFHFLSKHCAFSCTLIHKWKIIFKVIQKGTTKRDEYSAISNINGIPRLFP